jgi:hypothetical protein
MSFGSGSDFQKVPDLVLDPTLIIMLFLKKYYFKGPEMAWTQIRIRNPRVTDPDPDPTKVTDPCGSGSTTLNVGKKSWLMF